MQELIRLTNQYGLLLIFAGVLLETVGVPLPAMPLLIVAGALAVGGTLSIPAIVLVALFASLIGDLAWYLAGQRYGHHVLKTLCRISLSPDSCVRQTEALYGRWGARLLLVAKFVPGLSTVAPPLAGAMRLPLGGFLAYGGGGALIWIGVSLGAGALFHAQIALAGAYLERFGAMALYALAAAFGLFLLFKWWERRRFYRALRMARISVDELRRLVQGPVKPVILDVRSAAARRVDPRRIPGARAIDLEDAQQHLQGVPRGNEIVVYCSCPSEASAARVARLLMDHGYQHVRPLAGGLDAWADAGHEVEEEPRVEALGVEEGDTDPGAPAPGPLKADAQAARP